MREEELPSRDFGSQWVRRVEAWENIYLCRAPGSHSDQTPEEELCLARGRVLLLPRKQQGVAEPVPTQASHLQQNPFPEQATLLFSHVLLEILNVVFKVYNRNIIAQVCQISQAPLLTRELVRNMTLANFGVGAGPALP